MWGGLIDPKFLRQGVSLLTVVADLLVPIGVGIALDHYMGWGSWGTLIGLIVGFAGSLLHLVVLLKRQDANPDTKRDGP